MAPKQKPTAKPDPDSDEPSAEPAPDKPSAAPTSASPISTTAAGHVFRTDLGESLPPQKKAGVV